MKILKILVADDNQDVRELVRDVLEADGHLVTIVPDGEFAIRILNRERNFDLVVTDREMPRKSGEAVTEFAKQNFPEIKVVVMSGHLSEEIERTLARLGADRIIPKPLDVSRLLAILQELFPGPA